VTSSASAKAAPKKKSDVTSPVQPSEVGAANRKSIPNAQSNQSTANSSAKSAEVRGNTNTSTNTSTKTSIKSTDTTAGTVPLEAALSAQGASPSTSVVTNHDTRQHTPRRHTSNRAPSFQSNSQPVYQNSDRIAIFIDGSNLFYAASHLSIEVDYRRLLTTLVGSRRLLRAYFYTGVDPQNEKQRGFLLWLNRHGHRVVSKELAHLPDGSRKANMHVEMAVDMMRISEYCSTLTLLGGDGNLAYALQVLSQRGISLEVVSLQSMTSDSLIDLADIYTDLADLRDDIKR